MLTPALMVALTLPSCVSRQQVNALESKLAAMELRNGYLERELADCQGQVAQGAGDCRDREQQAAALVEQLDEHLEQARFDQARQVMQTLQTDFTDTRAARSARGRQPELEVIGRQVGPPEVTRWLSGGPEQVQLDQGTTLVVFWESWCPHCQREAPRSEALYQRYQGRLKMLGLTRINRSSTPDTALEFIETHQLSFPNAQETGAETTRYNVSGIPAAALVHEGEIVWRGHPMRLTDALLERWL